MFTVSKFRNVQVIHSVTIISAATEELQINKYKAHIKIM